MRHTEVLTTPVPPTVSPISVALAAKGDLGQAVSLLERAVTIRTSSLGPSHPHTLSSVSYLAEVCRRLGE